MLCSILIVALITVFAGFDTVWAGALSREIKFNVNGNGNLYFNLGPKLESCHIDSHKEFSEACKITSGRSYSLSTVVERGVIVCPDKNSTFEGFFSSGGQKVKLKAVKMDILRVKVGGTYVYTHFPSYGEGPATAITKPLYGEMVKKYVEEHYGEDLSLEVIAAHVHLHPAYLSKVFKENEDQNLSGYITNVRMEKAAQLLMEPELKVHDVMEKVGYQKSQYFSKLFREKYGVTPVEYKKSRQQ